MKIQPVPDSLEKELEELDLWHIDHRDAMECRDIEENIRLILEHLEVLWGVEDKLRELFAEAPESPKLIEIHNGYRRRLRAMLEVMADQGFRAYAFASEKGFRVEGLEELKRKFAEVQFSLMSNDTFFRACDLRQEAESACLEYLDGKTERMEIVD